MTFWDPMDCDPPGSSVHEISQTQILEWVAISFFREISCISGIWHCARWEALFKAGSFQIFWTANRIFRAWMLLKLVQEFSRIYTLSVLQMGKFTCLIELKSNKNAVNFNKMVFEINRSVVKPFFIDLRLRRTYFSPVVQICPTLAGLSCYFLFRI